MIDPDYLDALLRETGQGCPNDGKRRDRARRNINFYRADFEQHCQARAMEGYDFESVLRLLPIMRQIVLELTRHLYAAGPAREIPDQPELTAWLQDVYRHAGVDSKLQEADALAHAADVAAIQAEGTGDPDHPVRYLVWGSDEFTPFPDPADPTRPAAVATIDLLDETRRFRLWTEEAVYGYRSAKLMPMQTVGGRELRPESPEGHDYGLIPFAFVRVAEPTNQFFTGGPGDTLARMNEYLVLSLTDVGDSLLLCTKPVLATWGCDNLPPKGMRPGSYWQMAATLFDKQVPITPEARFLQPDPTFVTAHWEDIREYVELTLTTCGVPLAAFRMDQSATKSGAAIVAEQMPLVLRAMQRQRPAANWERDLARVTIAVGRAELRRLGAPVPAWLDPAQADRLTLRWPSMVPAVPLYGQQQTQADAQDLALGLVSRIQLVMRNLNLPREAAIKHLLQVAADLAEEQTIGLPPIPAPTPTASATDANADNAD